MILVMLRGRRARKLSAHSLNTVTMLMMALRKKKIPTLLCALFFLVKEKGHTGIENLALAVDKMKFKSKQRGNCNRATILHYFSYSTLYELNSESLKGMTVKMKNHHP